MKENKNSISRRSILSITSTAVVLTNGTVVSATDSRNKERRDQSDGSVPSVEHDLEIINNSRDGNRIRVEIRSKSGNDPEFSRTYDVPRNEQRDNNSEQHELDLDGGQSYEIVAEVPNREERDVTSIPIPDGGLPAYMALSIIRYPDNSITISGGIGCET